MTFDEQKQMMMMCNNKLKDDPKNKNVAENSLFSIA